MKKNSFLIFGNYGAKNFGDELVLKGIIEILKNSGISEEQMRVLSADPVETQKLFGINSYYVFPTGFKSLFRFTLLKTLKFYRQSGCVLFGGGTLFTDENPKTIWISGIQILPAVLMRKKIICFGQGVGPIRGTVSKRFVKWLFNRFSSILVRDEESRQNLESIGVTKKIQIVPDPALFLETEKKIAENNKSPKEVLFSLREWPLQPENFTDQMAAFASWIYQKHNLQSHLLVFGQRDGDKKLAESIAHKIHDYRAPVTEVTMTNYRDLFSRGLSAVNCRFHANILSFMAGIPSLGIPYETKIKNLYNIFGVNELIIESFDLDSLKKQFDHLLGNSQTISELLLKKGKTLHRQTLSVYKQHLTEENFKTEKTKTEK
ncbi:polysaccharide pyruvyl transferase family protein [Candidatus Peregrinibacteria bacterium]|nr:polysaccharide pyruvyl transferase family protein [Candidatus Peregrinibacteria bacterium]